jgi:Fe-S-cluster-containing dehydrogenase component
MKMIFDLDMEKCVACGACAVACMDQNDIWPDREDRPFRRVERSSRCPAGRKSAIWPLPACTVKTPPASRLPGGLPAEERHGADRVRQHALYRLPQLRDGLSLRRPHLRGRRKMHKCDGCAVRLENGLLPACVRVCPTGALTCRPEEEYNSVRLASSMRTIMERAKG